MMNGGRAARRREGERTGRRVSSRASGRKFCLRFNDSASARSRSFARSFARPPALPPPPSRRSAPARRPRRPSSLSIYLSMYLTRSPRVELPAPHAKTFTHARPARGVYPNLRGLGRNLSRVRIDLLTTFYDNSNNQRYAPRICMVSGHEVLKFDLSLI